MKILNEESQWFFLIDHELRSEKFAVRTHVASTKIIVYRTPADRGMGRIHAKYTN